MSIYTPNINDTGFPPTFLNAYIRAQLADFGLIAPQADNLVTPFVPAQVPTNIEDLYNDSIEIRQEPSPLLIIYDRLMRFRSNPFYRVKKEQLIYFIYTTDIDKLIPAVRVMTDALDREDASAQDVNTWCKNNPITYGENQTEIPYNIFFHNIKVYAADESRDVVELASARTLFVNKLIVEYDYHTNTPSNYRYN